MEDWRLKIKEEIQKMLKKQVVARQKPSGGHERDKDKEYRTNKQAKVHLNTERTLSLTVNYSKKRSIDVQVDLETDPCLVISKPRTAVIDIPSRIITSERISNPKAGLNYSNHTRKSAESWEIPFNSLTSTAPLKLNGSRKSVFSNKEPKSKDELIAIRKSMMKPKRNSAVHYNNDENVNRLVAGKPSSISITDMRRLATKSYSIIPEVVNKSKKISAGKLL